MNTIWKSRSSLFLYLYHYLFLVISAFILLYFAAYLVILPVIILLILVIDARTMKYELSEDAVYFSASLFRSKFELKLKDLVGVYVIDEAPWNRLSLGTVLLMTDFSTDAHRCIKCIKDPKKLGLDIRNAATKQGAKLN